MSSSNANQSTPTRSVLSSYLTLPTPDPAASLRRTFKSSPEPLSDLLSTSNPVNPEPSESSLQGHQLSHNELIDLRAAQRTFDGAYARTALGQLAYAVVVLKLFQDEFYYIGLAYTVLSISLVLISIDRYALAVGNAERWTEMRVFVPPSRASNPTSTSDIPYPQAEDLGGDISPSNPRARIRVQAPSQDGRLSLGFQNLPEEDEGQLNQSTLSSPQQRAATSNLSQSNSEMESNVQPGSGGTAGESMAPTSRILMRSFKTAGNVVAFAALGVGLLEATILILILRL